MTNPQKEVYEAPTFAVLGDLHEVTKAGLALNGDTPKAPSNAFGDS